MAFFWVVFILVSCLFWVLFGVLIYFCGLMMFDGGFDVVMFLKRSPVIGALLADL